MAHREQQPALHGGRPAVADGPPAWPPPDPEVLAALEAAYADGGWGRYHGPRGDRLREILAAMHEVPHVTLCSSGTVAVELALRGVGVEPGDEVVLAAYDFPGNFRAIEAIGATPVLVDIDPRSWCLDERQLAAAHGPAVRAILVSHLHGGLAAMREIREFAHERNIRVVEDACQAPGATVQGRAAGSWGDCGVLSFGGSKLLTAGRGGAVLTPRAEVHQRMKIFSHRGNDVFPLSELQAAVLPPQCAKLAARNAVRSARVAQLLAATRGLKWLTSVENRVAGEPSYYKLAWRYEPSGALSRETFSAACRAEGVAMDAGFRGFARRTARRCRKVGSLEHAARAAERTLLLHHPVLLADPSRIDAVAAALCKVGQTLLANGEIENFQL